MVKLVLEERARQDKKWGEQNHKASVWLAILGEETGEFCKAILEAQFQGASRAQIKTELVHVAAVALTMLECCERNGWNIDAKN